MRRFMLHSLPQMFVMAVVVDSALFIPVAGVLALLAFGLFGVSLHGFVTFGDMLNAFEGAVAWWIVLLAPSLVYAAYMMPWTPTD